jgi:hypothetical protein
VGRDIVIYAKKGEVVPLEDVLARLRELSTPALWRSMSGGSDTADWSMGYLDPVAEPGGTITISHEPVDDLMRAEALKAYAVPPGEGVLEHLSQARVVYQLGVPFTRDPGRDRLLANLIDVLAEAGDGVIIDSAGPWLDDLGSYRSRTRRNDGR